MQKSDTSQQHAGTNIIISLLLCTLLVLLQSCVREVKNINLPSDQPKLVISSFISPQADYIIVNVSLSNPLYVLSEPGPSKSVNNALVTISDGHYAQILPYNVLPLSRDSGYIIQNNSYKTVVNITQGRTYTLTVSTPDGKQVSATTTVPSDPNSSAQPIIDSLSSSNDSRNLKIDVQWNDIPGITDYYRVQYEIWGVNGNSMTLQDEKSFKVVNDVGNDGNTLIVKNGNRRISLPSNNLKQLHLSLSTIDINYYKYYKSLEAYSDDNPFAEPSLIYSNIENGLGVFGSYLEYIEITNF